MSLNIPKNSLKRVVIIGCGFAGLELAKKLRKGPFQIVIIDRNNYHQFQPLLYQVATAGLEPSSIAFPFRKIFHGNKNVHIRLAKVESVNPELKTIKTDCGELSFDYLVVATGAGNNFFNNQNIKDHSRPMKSISEALNLRNTIFENFEKALLAESKEERESYLNISIVGGGPTGVELAGAIAEMRNKILPKDYPDMDFNQMRIILIQGDTRLLNAMSEQSSEAARRYLADLGVEILFGARVTDYDGSKVSFKDGKTISTKTLIWAAGVTGNVIDGLKAEEVGPGGRILVNKYNQSILHNSIYAIGDIALIQDDTKFPNGHPQMAQPAIQQGRMLAENLIRLNYGKEMVPFKYKDLGSMATIGRNKAVVELPKRKFKGWFAWMLWLVVHLRSILGIKNKLFVLMNWIWNYLTYNLSLRLIIKSSDPNKKP